MKKIESLNLGIAGEHLAAARLTLNGYIATITSKNTKLYDILAYDPKRNKHFRIQVKTGNKKKPAWPLSKKNEEISQVDFYYIFINLFNSEDYYIVPSKVVADYIKTSHQKWLIMPGKKGQKHNDIGLRIFDCLDEKYKNKWNLK
jgi:hypothetical protein